jgi:Flp pilus assembly protein TadG
MSRLPPLTRLARLRLPRLVRDEGGLALLEFALSLPVLLSLGLLGLETSNLALAHLRVSNIAMLTADSAARVRDSIDESDVNQIFAGVRSAGTAIRFTNFGRVVLSSLEPNTAGTGNTSTGQWIRWQRCLGLRNFVSAYGAQGKGQNDASLQAMGPAGSQVSAQPGTAVMVVEVSYSYQPLIANNIFGPKTISYVSAFNVRQRTAQALTNVNNVQASTCTRFTS